jgi:hypothetical protein
MVILAFQKLPNFQVLSFVELRLTLGMPHELADRKILNGTLFIEKLGLKPRPLRTA